MKKLIPILLALGMMSLGALTASAQANADEKKSKKAKQSTASQGSDTAPKSVIHIVTVNWKSGATEQNIQAALDAAKKLPAQYPGITRVWTKPIKNQTDMAHVIVMEFANEKALTDYHQSDAQKEWYKSYMAVRDRSQTIDVTN